MTQQKRYFYSSKRDISSACVIYKTCFNFVYLSKREFFRGQSRGPTFFFIVLSFIQQSKYR